MHHHHVSQWLIYIAGFHHTLRIKHNLCRCGLVGPKPNQELSEVFYNREKRTGKKSMPHFSDICKIIKANHVSCSFHFTTMYHCESVCHIYISPVQHIDAWGCVVAKCTDFCKPLHIFFLYVTQYHLLNRSAFCRAMDAADLACLSGEILW